MNSQPKFTKGPWRVVWPAGDECRKILAADGKAIMGNETYSPWVPKSGSDWILIASSPDLYDQLQESTDCMVALVDALAKSGHSTVELVAQIDRNNEILTKARGDK